MSTRDGWFPWHFVMLTPSGHALHFSAELPHEQNHFAPWWFLGRVRGVRRSELCHALRESGRELRWRLSSAWMIHALLAIVTTVCLVPWLLAWFLWPAAWMVAGARHAVARRQRVLNDSASVAAAPPRLSAPARRPIPALPAPKPAGGYLAFPAHLAGKGLASHDLPAWSAESA